MPKIDVNESVKAIVFKILIVNLHLNSRVISVGMNCVDSTRPNLIAENPLHNFVSTIYINRLSKENRTQETRFRKTNNSLLCYGHPTTYGICSS